MTSHNGHTLAALDNARRALQDMQRPALDQAEQQRMHQQALAQQQQRVAELEQAARDEALQQAVRTAAEMAAAHVEAQNGLYGLAYYLAGFGDSHWDPDRLEDIAKRCDESWERLHQFCAIAAREYLKNWQPQPAPNDFWSKELGADIEIKQQQHRAAYGQAFTRLGSHEQAQPARVIMAAWLAQVAGGDPKTYRRRQALYYMLAGELIDVPANYDARAATRRLVERYRFGGR